MENDIIGRILEEIDSSVAVDEAGLLGFGEPDQQPAEFSRDNFHRLQESAENSNRMIFIDGGNAEIIASPSLSVHFIRIFYTIYQYNKRVSCSSDEFYMLSSAKNRDDKIFYELKLFKSKATTLTDSFFNEKFLFDSLDYPLCEGNSRFDISKTPGIIRRLAELSTALLLASRPETNDTIIIDGDLSTRLPNEQKLINALKNTAKQNNISVLALSKTSNILTSTANSAITIIKRFAPEGLWYYYPAALPASGNKVYFVKLHPSSDYIFKLETFESDKIETIFPSLAANSKDPVFIGYPYGLVEADRFARVSNREQEYLRTIFISKAGSNWNKIDAASKALDAHSVLDNVS
jgi:hypothetical protein